MKKFEKYFGSNIARKIYLVGVGLILVGLIVTFAYSYFYGITTATLGVIIFFITSSMQVSDREIDAVINSAASSYANEKINGRVIGKKTLDARDFAVFKGYVCDKKGAKFKCGRDGKMRTSNYFVTAMSVENKDCKVFTTVYDLFEKEAPIDRMICTKGADEVKFEYEPTEFPKGNFKCVLKTVKDGVSDELVFYVPNDALVDKMIAKIK